MKEFIWELIVTLTYLFDIFLWFNSGIHHHGGSIEMDQEKVRKHYIKSWLLIDILSVIPINMILHIHKHYPSDPQAWREPDFILILRFINLVKIIKLKVTNQISHLLTKFPSLYDTRHSLQDVYILNNIY